MTPKKAKTEENPETARITVQEAGRRGGLKTFENKGSLFLNRSVKKVANAQKKSTVYYWLNLVKEGVDLN